VLGCPMQKNNSLINIDNEILRGKEIQNREIILNDVQKLDYSTKNKRKIKSGQFPLKKWYQ
jgi:hypothetical protein